VATTTRGRDASPVTTPDPRRRRRVITWTALGIVALVAAVAAYWALARAGTVPAPPPVTTASTPPPASTTAAPTEPSGTDAGASARTANGCLGGQDPFQAVLAAEQAATPDHVGAAELALTFARWTVTYPIDTNAGTVADRVTEPSYRAKTQDSLQQYAQTMLSGGYTSAGTTPGAADQYRVRGTNQDQTSVTLDLIVYRQADKSTGEVETVQGFTNMTLDLVDGHWQVLGTLPAIGSDPFAPRADAPWVPYVGTC
jgi:hypothetical protein